MEMETPIGDTKIVFTNDGEEKVDLVEELLCVIKEIKRLKKRIIEEVNLI